MLSVDLVKEGTFLSSQHLQEILGTSASLVCLAHGPENTAQAGGRTALVFLIEAPMVVLLLYAWIMSWLMKCVFPSHTGHNPLVENSKLAMFF